MPIFATISRTIAIVVLLFATQTRVIAQDTVLSGEFTGMNNHTTTGSVSIVKDGDTNLIRLGDNFTFDGAPDPKVALGKNGEYDPATLIRALDANTGAQTYEIPDSIDISKYNEVYIWCEKFSVGLGVASLK